MLTIKKLQKDTYVRTYVPETDVRTNVCAYVRTLNEQGPAALRPSAHGSETVRTYVSETEGPFLRTYVRTYVSETEEAFLASAHSGSPLPPPCRLQMHGVNVPLPVRDSTCARGIERAWGFKAHNMRREATFLRTYTHVSTSTTSSLHLRCQRET